MPPIGKTQRRFFTPGHRRCPATLLLESADIDSKDDLKSLLLVDSALRITALGDTVTIQALSDNGASLLPLLDTTALPLAWRTMSCLPVAFYASARQPIIR